MTALKLPSLFFILLVACSPSAKNENESQEINTSPSNSWQLLPFSKHAENPVLGPKESTLFYCPARNEKVAWEVKDLFNPAAIVKDGKVHMIYRAEDSVGAHAGTSRLGLAISEDGIRFERQQLPIFYPKNDVFKALEWEGGCEDPRIVQAPDGKYVMTYTAYDGKIARLCVATSPDLLEWEKHGSVFSGGEHPNFENLWSKSGAIVSQYKDGTPVAAKVGGKYWMFWGDLDIFAATSDNLIHWSPVLTKEHEGTDEVGSPTLLSVLKPRANKFDSRLVEPGPPAMITENGILLIYNASNSENNGDKNLPKHAYAAGQALFDLNNPTKLLNRSEESFLLPQSASESEGQVNNVCFVEGLVKFKGKWFLYYGMADSYIGVAVSEGDFIY